MAKADPGRRFIKAAQKAGSEEAVIDAYQRLLAIDELPRPFGCDGYSSDTLFEAKLQGRLVSAGHVILAQACYYLRRFQMIGISKGVHYAPPIRVACVDKNEAFVVKASSLSPYTSNNMYDWERPPSSPDLALVSALQAERLFVHDMTSEAGIAAFVADISTGGDRPKQLITRENFALVFQVWRTMFPDLTPQEAALAFFSDIQCLSFVSEARGMVSFQPMDNTGAVLNSITTRVEVPVYRRFWDTYKLPPDAASVMSILEAKDQLIAMQSRRSTGEFFTPIELAALAHEYIGKAIPNEGGGVHHSMYDSHYWWDCCCGTGNLTLICPSVMRDRLVMSTLNPEDVSAIQMSGQNPGAILFPYDFLNQPDAELPEAVKKRLTPGSKWVFILNPPFAAGTTDSMQGGRARRGMSDTEIRASMQARKLGHACQNLYSQFLFKLGQLKRDYQLNMTIGAFSMARWLNGTGFKAFRKLWYEDFEEQGGFCFRASEFNGTTGKWPCVFTVWRTR